MNEQDLTESFPCSRGCTWPGDDDTEPKPKEATHGNLCASCYYRLKRVLEMVPDLMANMRLAITPGGAQVYDSERISGGGDGSPVPLRVDALDASDALYAKLVSWSEVVGGALHHPQPKVAVWISLQEVMGSKPVTPFKAHEIADQLTGWFLARLDDIAAQSFAKDFHDDLCWGFDQDNRGVFKLAGQYGVEPRPMRPAEKRECPICGRREVFVKWPDPLDPELSIMCGRCKWVAEPEKYGHYAKLFAV